MKQDRINWGKLVITVVGLIGFSFGLAYLFWGLATRLRLPLYQVAWLAYLTVFLSSLIANAAVLAPVPIGLSIMIAAATRHLVLSKASVILVDVNIECYC